MPCDHCHLPYLTDIPHGSDETCCLCVECPGCGTRLSPELDDPAPYENCDHCHECCRCWEPVEGVTPFMTQPITDEDEPLDR